VKKVIIGLSAVIVFYAVVSGSHNFDEHKHNTLDDFKIQPIAVRHDVIEDYVSEKELPDDAVDSMYACVSQMLFTKDKDLLLDEIASWCLTNYENKKIETYVNFDNFEKGFHQWDGSFIELERRIKGAMNDSDSYEHVKTNYRLVLNNNPRAIVTTEFKGTNDFGGIVKNKISANVDIKTGEITEIIQ